ncbi:B3 domain-containing protein [Striga asiatica]|uniref:B3 domain-containing protein n=1 Tax=Striga asiatica TaxID=4170 RepID=A0A5A7P5L5_STRAF|nr:B3 domain-containing protein [Striga asiatica]
MPGNALEMESGRKTAKTGAEEVTRLVWIVTRVVWVEEIRDTATAFPHDSCGPSTSLRFSSLTLTAVLARPEAHLRRSRLHRIPFRCSVMAGDWTRFFKIILDTQMSSLSLPPAICEYHESELPKKCIIETREGREYEVMMKMVDNGPTLVDGWDTYVQEEYIELHNIMFFKRKSKFHFDVMPIPMPFWRDHIEDNYDNYTTAVLIFDKKVYKLDVIHGNGKKLLQYRGARKFVIDSGIVVGSSCMFTHVGPHKPDDVITFRVKI